MKILLVDDHQMFLDGLSAILNSSTLEASVEVASNGRTALERLLAGDIDIALIDLRLPVIDGFTLLDELKQCNSLTPVIVVSASRDPDDIRRCMSLGAMSFIPKSSSGQRIIQTIIDVMAGNMVFDTGAAERKVPDYLDESKEWAALHNITPRQLEVLRLVRKGLSNQAIAEELFLSVATVKSHLSAIFYALGAQNRSESSKKAHQLGLD
ncbi:MAG: response regulator transcription factor [Thalassolituus sp.]